MCSIQFECCPSTTVTLVPIKNSLITLSLYLSTVFQSFRAGEKGYYVTRVQLGKNPNNMETFFSTILISYPNSLFSIISRFCACHAEAKNMKKGIPSAILRMCL